MKRCQKAPLLLLMKTFEVQKLFLPFRLAQYIILSVIIGMSMGYPELLHVQFVLYSIATLGFAVLLAVDKKQKYQLLTISLITIQFILEIIVESSIIYTTGNINSQFSLLFILTIISASLIFRLIGTLMIASFVSISYSLIIWGSVDGGQLPKLSFKSIQDIYLVGDSFFYPTFMHILIFYLIAFLSGYLAERIRSRDQELATTSLALKKAKLETDDILRNLNSGLLSIDHNGEIIYFNKAAERILDYREENIKGVSCSKVFSERMPELARILMQGITEKVAYPRKEIRVIDQKQRENPGWFVNISANR